MASPFNVFRKHQRWMIAGLGIVAMISFVLMEPLMALLGGGSVASRNPVVVTTKYGEVRESEMQRMVFMRGLLNQFLYQAYLMGSQAGAKNQADPRAYMHEESEQGVVQTMLTAKKAQEVGFVVSDRAINEVLKEITGGAVKDSQLRQLIAGASFAERSVTMEQIFNAMREAMLATRLRSTLVPAMYEAPAQSWEYYTKLNDQITVEVLPVDVEKFVGEIADPSEEELTKFFDKYKNNFPNPIPVEGVELQPREPGFAQPKKAAFQYARVNFDDLVDQLAKTITEEEIVKHYEENKESYRIPELLPEDDDFLKDDPKQDDKSKDQAPADTAPQADANKNHADSATGKAKDNADAEAKKTKAEDAVKSGEADQQQPASEEKSDAKSAEQPSADEPAADEESKAKEPATENPEDLNVHHLDLAAARQDEDQAEEEKESADKVEDTQEGSEAPEAPQDPASEAAADEKSEAKTPDASQNSGVAEDVKPSDEGAQQGSEKEIPGPPEPADEEPTAGDEGKKPTSEEKPVGASKDKKQPEKRYSTLDEERDSIRRELAQEKVAKMRGDLLTPLRDLMMQYHNRLVRHRISEESKREGYDGKEPVRPNLKAEAEKAGLEFEQTELISYRQLAEIPLGEAVVEGRPQVLAQTAFETTDMNDFRPITATTRDGDGFLVWKIEEKEAFVPTLDQIRDQVIRAWKMDKARGLAEKEAEKLAAEAREKKLSLSKTFNEESGYEVVTTDPFSWLTAGSVPMRMSITTRLSTVHGVEDAGPEFMKKVFALKPGEITVVPNFPESVYYVVEMVGHVATEEALHTNFLRQGPWQQLARENNYYDVLYNAVLHMDLDADMNWSRNPDQRAAASN